MACDDMELFSAHQCPTGRRHGEHPPFWVVVGEHRRPARARPAAVDADAHARTLRPAPRGGRARVERRRTAASVHWRGLGAAAGPASLVTQGLWGMSSFRGERFGAAARRRFDARPTVAGLPSSGRAAWCFVRTPVRPRAPRGAVRPPRVGRAIIRLACATRKRRCALAGAVARPPRRAGRPGPRHHRRRGREGVPSGRPGRSPVSCI